jgi:ABC-2 type transport system ATP-binding protein
MDYTVDSQSAPPAVEVHGLSVSYGHHAVLSDLDLTVTRGIYALLGPNGAGKTTLVNALTTVLRPTEGSIRVDGHPITDRAAIRRLISVTGQFAAVDDLLTTTENLELVGTLLGLSRTAARQRAAELIADFDLDKHARLLASKLSGGTRRRLDLAMSLVVRPAVLFLDEPTTGLDPASRRRLWAGIRHLAAQGTTVLLTTQYLEEAEALADRIGVLSGGSIVAEGTATELAEIAGSAQVVLSSADGETQHTLPSDGTVAGVLASLGELGPDSASLRVELRRPTLEDAFTAITDDPTIATTREDHAA